MLRDGVYDFKSKANVKGWNFKNEAENAMIHEVVCFRMGSGAGSSES